MPKPVEDEDLVNPLKHLIHELRFKYFACDQGTGAQMIGALIDIPEQDVAKEEEGEEPKDSATMTWSSLVINKSGISLPSRQ